LLENIRNAFNKGNGNVSDILDIQILDTIRDARIPLENSLDWIRFLSGKTEYGIILNKDQSQLTFKHIFTDPLSGQIFGSETQTVLLKDCSEIKYVMNDEIRERYNLITTPEYNLTKALDSRIECAVSRDDIFYVESPNVIMKGVLDKSFLKEALYYLELVIKGFQMYFEKQPQPLSVKLRVLVIPTIKLYLQITKNLFGKELFNPAVFIPGLNMTLILNPHSILEKIINTAIELGAINEEAEKRLLTYSLDQLKKEVIQSLFHESFHFYLDYLVRSKWKLNKIPIWINEGFAVFFQHVYFEGKEFLLGGMDSEAVESIFNDVQNNKTLTLKEVISALPEDFQVTTLQESAFQKSQQCYNYSWALVHFLTYKFKLSQTDKLFEYLKIIQIEKDTVFCFEALTNLPLEIFEAEWKEYLNKNLFKKKYE
jgi:hypothetical protein